MKKKSKVDKILQLEKKNLKEEKKVEALERKQLKELENLKKIELNIKKEVGEHPLRKVTYKDVGKSMIGAFVGLVSHFAVLEGLHFSESVSLFKANLFYIVSFCIGMIIIYYTGFRKIRDTRLLALLPLRLVLVYSVTIFTILIVLLIIGNNFENFFDLYRQVAVLTLPAIIGACAADLIGGE